MLWWRFSKPCAQRGSRPRAMLPVSRHDVNDLFRELAIRGAARRAGRCVDRDGLSARITRPRTAYGTYAAAPCSDDDRGSAGIAGSALDQIQRENFSPGV